MFVVPFVVRMEGDIYEFQSHSYCPCVGTNYSGPCECIVALSG